MRHTPVAFVLWLGAASACLAGCGGEPPKRPNVMHPVHERRAVEIIARVFKEAQLDPTKGPQILITTRGATLEVDVVAAGRKFGIAYQTREQTEAAGNAVPKFDPDSDALVIVDGVDKDAGWHVLLMDDRAYLSDDLEGEEHSATSIAAEKKIERDTRDFVLKAQHEKW